MGVTRHVRVTSEKVKDAALDTVDYADDSITAAKILDHTLGSQNFSTANVILQNAAQIKAELITEPKFSEHLEHGTVTSVTATGRYKTLTGFGGVPDIVLTEITGSLAARLMGTPVAGSFGVKLTTAGTQDVMFQAWGARA